MTKMTENENKIPLPLCFNKQTMKNSIVLFGLMFILACNDNPATNPDQKLSDSTGMISQSTPVDSLLSTENTIENNIEADSMEAIDANPDIETMYVVIADTGKNYALLNTQMYAIAKQTQGQVDTLGRYYNTKKNKIVLREDDSDELYAGEYFPRRFPSTTLSMEYMDTYTPGANEAMIGIVAGIFENQADGEKTLQTIKAVSPNARLVKADIYVGCIH
jgi:hypothetical protein